MPGAVMAVAAMPVAAMVGVVWVVAMVEAAMVVVAKVVAMVEAAKGATMAARAQQSQQCACASPQHRPAPNTVHTCPQ